MMATPLPPEHTQVVPFTPCKACAEDESDLFDDSFSFKIQHTGTTYGYGITAIAKPKGHNGSDRDPPSPSVTN